MSIGFWPWKRNTTGNTLPRLQEEGNSASEDTDVHEEAEELEHKPGRRFVALSTFGLFCLVLVLSLLIHWAGIRISYEQTMQDEQQMQTLQALHKDEDRRQQEQATMAENEEEPEKEKSKEHDPEFVAKQDKDDQEKQIAKALSPEAKTALGRETASRIRDGQLPGLVLSYPDPRQFVQAMYARGALTLLYDEHSQSYKQVDLLQGTIGPIPSQEKMQQFSNIKRIVEDPIWREKLARIASRMGKEPSQLKIVLLIPYDIELRWLGHQAHLFEQTDIPLTEVQNVEAVFRQGRLYITKVHLKDAKTLTIQDESGVG